MIYRRCPAANIEDPFNTIKLADVSVNRQGPAEQVYSEPEDVLFNYNPENGKGETLDEAIVSMRISEVNFEGKYVKSETYSQPSKKDGNPVSNICEIQLKHKMDVCNYSHCAFEIFYNGEQMTFENYKKSLQKNSYLKSWCKNELSKMIIRKEIKINW